MLLFFGVNAQTSTPGVSDRQLNQTGRIMEGVKDGDLTPGETRQLRRQQRDIQRTKKEAKADGKVTRQERREINRKQKHASRNIKRKKNNLRNVK
ncbi:hypothetical protein HH304_17800 [Flammeovirgaceae bacterium KN852]|uniref:Uncharacterized protein n=2 Tax=Marinigracilibium pacificum TaxID=2729599 RepID=A0A848J4Q4_9BACT|nr:hypothetical protein [Marinigracilibium pacificum]